MNKKITLIGAGQIGGTLAHLIATKKIGDVVLFDVAEGIAKGKALDIAQSSPIENFDINITGTSKYSDTKDSDVIIITAGVPRKPGMTRDDLLEINLKIIKQVANGIKDTSPNAFVICITNPLDVIVMALQKYSGLPKNKVVGMAGILDSSRFIYFLSQELKISVSKIKSLVLGGHGDTMVAMVNHTFINGTPIKELIKAGKISEKRIIEIINRTKTGGAEIVKYLEKGSAFYAPASSGIEMAESYLKDQKKELPCAAYINGEYDVKDIYAGVPVIIGKNGVEKIIELKLNKDEKENFSKSINAVKELFNAAKKLIQVFSRYLPVIFLGFFAFFINYYYGFIGLMPMDNTVLYNGGYKVLNGFIPFKDYWLVTGPLLDYLNAMFFLFLDVSWQSFIIHSSAINLFLAVSSYFLFISLKIKKNYSLLYSALICLLFYPVVGTPFVDHHATFFLILAFYFFISAINNSNNIYFY